MRLSSSRTPQQLVDDQVALWARSESVAVSGSALCWPLVTVSREFAARGAAVARRVADVLDFSYWDREIVEAITRDTGARETMTRSLDEAAMGALDNFLRDVLIGSHSTQSTYLRHLARLIRAIEFHGAGVVVGRGASFVVGDRSLRVRIISPLDKRALTYAALNDLTTSEATADIQRVDRERAKFIRQVYRRDVSDPHGYDIVVNSGEVSEDTVATMVIEAYRAKFAKLSDAVAQRLERGLH